MVSAVSTSVDTACGTVLAFNMSPGAAAPRNKLVYVYVDRAGRPKYVGKGDVNRALSHGGGSANPELNAWVAKHPDHEVRVTGPLTDDESVLVEAAVISAMGLDELFNKSPADRRGRFRPLHVPTAYSDRLLAEPLDPTDVARELGGALFVIVNSAPLDEPSIESIAHATEQAWMIDPFVQAWHKSPESIPRALVAVTTRGRRYIQAAFEIDRDAYRELSDIPRFKSRWWIPLANRSNADFGELRGRRIRIKFGSVTTQHSRWYDSSGELRPY